jgi:signal transduction histidine kinase
MGIGRAGAGLTIHRKLAIAFSLSASLLVLIGLVSYFYNSFETILLATSAAVAVIMVSGFFIYHSIMTPLDRMKSVVKEIAKGNFDVNVGEDARCDEIGELARSITQMKNDLKEKDHLKDEFINVASHELRTPIQPIVSYVDLARKGVVGQDKAFQVVMDQARRLKRLADDILDVSRIEGRRLVLTKEYFSVNDVIAKIIEEKRPDLAGHVVMQFKPAGGEDKIYADRSRIMQVLANIIDNAIKFTKKGSIEIITAPVDGKSAVEISVIDTGGGIPDEMFPKLFTKFATRSVAYGTEHGTGLGLFISKSIVEAHGGTIAGLNNDRGGATFRMILPVISREENKGASARLSGGDKSALPV